MGELRYTQQAVEERKRRISSAPPKSGKEVQTMMSSFKPPPEVSIRINGFERFIDPKKFFGKADGEMRPFLENSETVLSLINNFGTRDAQQEVALYLMEILPKFGKEEPFIEMVKTSKEILGINKGNISSGNSASINFLERIAHVDVECEADKITEMMRAFRSEPILESFRLFAGIGEVTFKNAAYQLVELGVGLKNPDMIEKIGRTIIEINTKFGIHATLGYRSIILGIARNNNLSATDKAELVDRISEKMLSFDDDAVVSRFSGEVEPFVKTYNLKEVIITACRKEY